MTVEVRYYTDPACPRSWGAEPELRRLMWEFGGGLRFRWVMGGLAREYFAAEHPALVAEWLDLTADTGMPTDPRLWLRTPIASSHPACQAVKAATEQGSEAGYAYLRRVREGLMVARRKLDHAEALVGEAEPAGLDVERFRIDLDSNATIEGFAADLEEVRGGGIELPSAYFASADGSRHIVAGGDPYDSYREAALAVGAAPATDRLPGALEVVERFGRVATREVEALTGKPRAVVEAELWSLAREWRLRPVPVLTGTLWERP
jgi:predicted DsbA family dithiol-disulfide isomerase